MSASRTFAVAIALALVCSTATAIAGPQPEKSGSSQPSIITAPPLEGSAFERRLRFTSARLRRTDGPPTAWTIRSIRPTRASP